MKIPAKTENPHITYERNNFRAKVILTILMKNKQFSRQKLKITKCSIGNNFHAKNKLMILIKK